MADCDNREFIRGANAGSVCIGSLATVMEIRSASWSEDNDERHHDQYHDEPVYDPQYYFRIPK